MSSDPVRDAIRTVPDWPQPGILFRDITPVLQDAELFRALIGRLAARYRATPPDLVAGIDARGFIIGAALAHALGVGFVPVRKKGKLPFATLAEDYALEYGTASVEIHVDACLPGQRVLLVDDLLATGGTLLAAARLVRRLGGEIAEAAVLVALPELGGMQRLDAEGLLVHAECVFTGS